MPDPDLTPEALKRLVERGRAACDGHPNAQIPWPHRILHEMCAAISALMADTDERLKEADDNYNAVAFARDHERTRAEQAEAKLRGIASYCADCLPETATTLHAVARARADKIYRIGQYANGETDSIARSTSQGGEG